MNEPINEVEVTQLREIIEARIAEARVAAVQQALASL